LRQSQQISERLVINGILFDGCLRTWNGNSAQINETSSGHINKFSMTMTESLGGSSSSSNGPHAYTDTTIRHKTITYTHSLLS
jgi:hypothetical protein